MTEVSQEAREAAELLYAPGQIYDTKIVQAFAQFQSTITARVMGRDVGGMCEGGSGRRRQSRRRE